MHVRGRLEVHIDYVGLVVRDELTRFACRGPVLHLGVWNPSKAAS